MCSDRKIPVQLLETKLSMVAERDLYAEYLGSYNSSGKKDGTGVLGEISKLQAFIRWADTPKGIESQKQQAAKQGASYVKFRIQQINRWKKELAKAQAEAVTTKAELARVEAGLAAFDADNPLLKHVGATELQRALDGLEEGIEEISLTRLEERLATEAATQDLSDEAIAEAIDRAS